MAKDKAYRKAEEEIQQALESGATELDLSGMGLTELPPELWKLNNLKSLKLGYEYSGERNQLKKIPKEIGNLTQLIELNISSNQLTTLPDSLSRLTQLTKLDLGSNSLTALPIALKPLRRLERLDLSYNELTELPDWLEDLSCLQHLVLYHNRFNKPLTSVGKLTQLSFLDIGDNSKSALSESFCNLLQLQSLELPLTNLEEIPIWVKDLKNLRRLKINANEIKDLPDWFAQLEHLTSLELSGNPLNPALESAYAQGLPAVKAYLRSLEQNAEPLYEAKLVLVGEGGVGKTTLLNALIKREDRAPKKDEKTTHGVKIDVDALQLPHPEREGVKIQLNAWDFGGQDVYRVTHQFFFSRRSLYLLVWEPRRGVQQCQVEDWLNMIRLRVGDDARVIIVSTNSRSGEHIARIDKPVLQQRYGEMIVGFYEVDSLVPDKKTGEKVGIAELREAIAAEAAKLEQMGMKFNRNWKAARDQMINHNEPRISYTAFGEICASHGLSQIDADTLAHLMHDLGYIVHYSDDEKLRDDVVLKPEWLTKAIGFVLEDRVTQETDGILSDSRLFEVWHDHKFKDEPRYTRDLYPFFLRLMEKYDVSYRLPVDEHASLVAQHVPQVRPALPWLPEQEPPENLRRIAMICAMEEDPPGLVPWMIVRTHDYAVEQNKHRLHWQKGMFLSHPPHGEAMLEKRGREFHVYAQGDWPEYFMNVLQHTLQKLITDNWPGMEGRYGFMVPCPQVIDSQPCKGRFKIQSLRKFLIEGDSTVRCQECSCKKSIVELLFGFEERDMSVQLREIKEQLAGLDSRIANYFMATMRAIADEAKHGPRLFTLRSREAGLSPKQILYRPMELHLWCEAEGCQHPVTEKDKGVYPIDIPYEWVKDIAPYAKFVLKVLSTVAPIAAPAINSFFGAKTTENWKIDDRLDLAKEIIDKLPDEIKIPDRGLSPGQILSDPERSGILALHRFLNEVDPTQKKLGLHRVATYTGDYRWLCQKHYDDWQPNIPDVIRS